MEVSYIDATAYADWANKTLPTAHQWEKAARGTTGTVWPWGNQASAAKCNARETGIATHHIRVPLSLRRQPRTIVRIKGQGLVANRVKSKASERGLLLPPWCVELLRARRVRLGGFDGPVFPDSRGGWRDRSNVGKVFREVRAGSDFEWVKTHTYRKSVATLLDQSGASARMIADQLGHSRVSMTQDVYLGRRATNSGNLAALEAYNPDSVTGPAETGEQD